MTDKPKKPTGAIDVNENLYLALRKMAKDNGYKCVFGGFDKDKAFVSVLIDEDLVTITAERAAKKWKGDA